MMRPTRVEPVKLTRRTAGWAISASTIAGASSGALVTTLTTPGGRPASRRHSPISRCVPRADLGRLEHHRVAAGERHGDRAHAEDDRRVPRRDAEHDAGRLADRHGDAARLVGRDDLAGDLRGHRGGLAQHAGGEVHVEMGPAGGGAGLGRHQRDESAAPSTPAGRRPSAGWRAARSGRLRTRPGRRPRRRRRRACASATGAAAARLATSPVIGLSAVEGRAVRRRRRRLLSISRDDVVHGMSSPQVWRCGDGAAAGRGPPR